MWKTVCDKVVCESWYVTKCAWKMVCDRWCVTKMCVSMWKTVCDKVVCVKVGIDKFQSVCERSSVTDGVWQRCASENCWQRLYDRWCVSKVCVKDGVWLAGVWQRCVWDGLWNQGGCHICEIVPRLPCETKVDDRRCHQVPRLPRKVPRRHARPKRAQARHPGPWVPRLPRKTKVDVRLCHACHAKRPWMWDCATPATWWMSPSATPATQSAAVSRATKRAQARHPVPWVPRLPRKTKVDVRLRHPCHVKPRWMSPSATPATQSAAASRATKRAQARHPVPWVPRLPRKTTVDVRLCHACHVEPKWMSPSATPATQSAAASRATKRAQARHPVPWVPRLPRKTTVDVRLCHACHVEPKWMSPSATPATQSAAASRATKRAQARHPVPWVPRLPRKTKVDVRLRHACHAKPRWMSPSATPATQSAAASSATHACHVKRRWISPSATPATQRWYVTDCMWQSCVWSYVCDRWYVTKLCVKFVCVWSYVCDRWYVTKLCVKFVCVKYGMWQSCMLSLCVWSYCMWEMVCDRRKEAGGGRREAGATRDTESKTRTPHKVVRNQ